MYKLEEHFFMVSENIISDNSEETVWRKVKHFQT